MSGPIDSRGFRPKKTLNPYASRPHVPHAGTFLEAPVSAFEATNRINYLGVVHTLKAVLPGMVERCVHKASMVTLSTDTS